MWNDWIIRVVWLKFGYMVLSSANLILWALRTRDSRQVLNRYDYWTRFCLINPFSSGWRRRIGPADQPILARFRCDFLRNYVLLWALPILVFTLILWLLITAHHQELLEGIGRSALEPVSNYFRLPQPS